MVEIKIYDSIINELNGIDKENAHSMGVKLSKLIAIGLLSDRERSIFDRLSLDSKTTAQISKELGMPSKNISSSLIYMESKLSFIHSKIDDKGNRIWITTLEII